METSETDPNNHSVNNRPEQLSETAEQRDGTNHSFAGPGDEPAPDATDTPFLVASASNGHRTSCYHLRDESGEPLCGRPDNARPKPRTVVKRMDLSLCGHCEVQLEHADVKALTDVVLNGSDEPDDESDDDEEEWEPEQAGLREGESRDESAHASRMAEQMRIVREAEEDDGDSDDTDDEEDVTAVPDVDPDRSEIRTDGGELTRDSSTSGAIDHDFDEHQRDVRDQLDENLKGIRRAPGPGDVCIDLVTRQVVSVETIEADTVLEYYEEEGFDLRSYKANPYLPVTLEDTVYGVVYCERSVDGIHSAGKVYPTPRGRLARIPTEQAESIRGDDS